MEDSEMQLILTFENLEPSNIWYILLKNDQTSR